MNKPAKQTTNLRILLEDLHRFKAAAAQRRVTMTDLFTRVCDGLEEQYVTPATVEDFIMANPPFDIAELLETAKDGNDGK